MKNRIKVLSCRVQQCLGPVNTLTPERCSDKGPFTHLSKNSFRSQLLRKYLSYEAHLSFQNVLSFMKISKTQKKIPQRDFVFLDNCIWIRCSRYSVIWLEYLSSAVNMVANSPIIKREIFQLNLSKNHNKLEKSAVAQISAVFDTR